MSGDNVAMGARGSVSDAGSRGAVAYFVRIGGKVTCGTVRARVRAAFHRGGPSPPLADPA
ncbi:hypothetical protein RR48_07079 [Papilio machaon]|uniref:Uncharacterized protein n=2 Tax=Papilio TaxID=7145 RepID=A0A194PY20_PAPXU|nr:hypothetical protein RR46_09443 [Papilio xuthus]KPJ13499.1 hypothetical protein RR48_07079 [Papilio machaon]